MPDRVKAFLKSWLQNKHRSFRCDYERTYQGSESEDDGLLCGSSIKSQFEICGVYSKKRYTREVVDLR